jgi:hypothetical protein
VVFRGESSGELLAPASLARALSVSLVMLAVACTGRSDEEGERFEFSDFSGGFFEEPDYRRIYATCPPGRLQVEFDPDSEAEVSYGNGDPVVSLSAEGAVIGCGDAVVDDRVGGFQQRGISTVRKSIELECRSERPIDIQVDPLFGRGERNVVGGSFTISTPARNVAPRILIAATFDKQDDRETLTYRTGRCSAIET